MAAGGRRLRQGIPAAGKSKPQTARITAGRTEIFVPTLIPVILGLEKAPSCGTTRFSPPTDARTAAAAELLLYVVGVPRARPPPPPPRPRPHARRTDSRAAAGRRGPSRGRRAVRAAAVAGAAACPQRAAAARRGGPPAAVRGGAALGGRDARGVPAAASGGGARWRKRTGSPPAAVSGDAALRAAERRRAGGGGQRRGATSAPWGGGRTGGPTDRRGGSARAAAHWTAPGGGGGRRGQPPAGEPRLVAGRPARAGRGGAAASNLGRGGQYTAAAPPRRVPTGLGARGRRRADRHGVTAPLCGGGRVDGGRRGGREPRRPWAALSTGRRGSDGGCRRHPSHDGAGHGGTAVGRRVASRSAAVGDGVPAAARPHVRPLTPSADRVPAAGVRSDGAAAARTPATTPRPGPAAAPPHRPVARPGGRHRGGSRTRHARQGARGGGPPDVKKKNKEHG